MLLNNDINTNQMNYRFPYYSYMTHFDYCYNLIHYFYLKLNN